jgi:mono/diheme cytochrome c family protein
VQYIAASVGGTAQGDYFAPSYARMLVFKVGGTLKLPANAPYTPRQLNPPLLTASTEVVARGSKLYADHCSACHGANTVAAGGRAVGPDLGTSPFINSQPAFDTVVLQGQRVERGMANFSDKLKPEDSVAVLSYVVSRAIERKNAPAAPAGGPGRGPGGAGAPAGAPAGARPAGAAAAPGAPAPRPAAPAPAGGEDVHQQAAGGN